ncbi:DsbA family protein [Nocardioides sp.]|uniref:DsbA family protein n=1 Tax=Nocardioides sp. TaxID=35761 RepID=UPI0026220E44|nr:DsbA family protein [Nocardioides sp.]MDI6910612.1 DsbA family protein [Nocardioides sp.]
MSKQGRIRTQQLREAQRIAQAQQARRRRLVTAVGAVVILGLVAAIVFAVVSTVTGDDDGPQAASGDVVAPANIDPSGSFAVGQDDAPVTVEIYYDYMCPACGAFEAANSGELDRLVADGTARIELRPISFLDEQSRGTRYSTRAANAFATVVHGAPEQAWAFHTALYENQPDEGTEGLSDDEIAAIARDAGVPDDVVERFGEGTYEPWTASVTQKAFDSGIQGTPTVVVDGEQFQGDVYTVGPLTEAIESAAASQ